MKKKGAKFWAYVWTDGDKIKIEKNTTDAELKDSAYLIWGLEVLKKRIIDESESSDPLIDINIPQE